MPELSSEKYTRKIFLIERHSRDSPIDHLDVTRQPCSQVPHRFVLLHDWRLPGLSSQARVGAQTWPICQREIRHMERRRYEKKSEAIWEMWYSREIQSEAPHDYHR